MSLLRLSTNQQVLTDVVLYLVSEFCSTSSKNLLNPIVKKTKVMTAVPTFARFRMTKVTMCGAFLNARRMKLLKEEKEEHFNMFWFFQILSWLRSQKSFPFQLSLNASIHSDVHVSWTLKAFNRCTCAIIYISQPCPSSDFELDTTWSLIRCQGRGCWDAASKV